jgi:hypothetical protein
MKQRLVWLVPGVLAAAAVAQPFDLPEDRAEFESRSQRGLLARMQGWDPESGVPFDADANRICSKERRLRAYFEAGLSPQGPAGNITPRGPVPADPTDVLHNALEIEVAPPGNSLTGVNTMTIRSTVNGLNSFTFRLRWNFTVTRCTVTDSVGSYDVTPTIPSPTAVPPSYGRTFSLIRPVDANQIFTVRIEYNGALQSGIGLGSVVYGGQNGNSSNPGVVCTLSEPYYAATWWPCKDSDVRMAGDNSDKATLSMSITAPDTFKSVANGVLQGVDTLSGNRLRYRWATNYPMSTYLVAFATTAYNVFNINYNHPGGVMPLDFYIYTTSDTPANRAVWGLIPSMLEAFRPIYGEYPFINEKYGIYQFEFGGGMEHQTFTGQGGGGAFNETVTAHELAHQWWGDSVTCRSWSDIWLNEGFATYGEALWIERKPGSTGLPALRTAMNNRRPSDANGTVWIAPYNPADPGNITNNTGNAGRIFSSNYTYRKAGWVLHMLRKIVGDATFFNILAAHRAAGELGTMSTADFTTLASGVAGQDLSWFFNPWLYQTGAPVYNYAWEPVSINGQPYARLMIRQTQSGTIFDMPIDVRLNNAAGTQIALVNVRNNAATQHYLIPLTSAVGTATGASPSVVLDPDNWILEYGKTIIAYQQGPPKIVSTVPFAGVDIDADMSPSAVTITFSDPVEAAAADFAVTRDGSPVPFTFAYNGGTQTVTLTFTGPLAPGSYAVGVSDNVRSSTGLIALDGEITISGDGFGQLPSGDGLPGGSAAFGFTVLPGPCPVDFNDDGSVTVQDIFDFLAAYFAGNANANFNGDAGVSVQDIFDYLAAYFAGCP